MYPLFDLVCFSHLPWDFVFQRPQHLLTRAARERRVFYIQEPEWGGESVEYAIAVRESGVWVVRPRIPDGLSEAEVRAARRQVIDELFAERAIHEYVLWFYTPMPTPATQHLAPLATVYDCMDDLATFLGAPAALREREPELLARADLVFTGGHSLYEAKRSQHPHVYELPSSVDTTHFARARQADADPDDQAGIPHPRLGYFGVIDERMDLDLVRAVADARPDWQLIFIGPVTKIAASTLPRRANIHYLGKQDYADLPRYLAGWDVALLPFALSEATRLISPTKTPEYLAAGRPVVATPIRDVAHPYGAEGLVRIAETRAEFVAAIAAALSGDDPDRLARVDAFLARMSWEQTWINMRQLVVEAVMAARQARAREARASGGNRGMEGRAHGEDGQEITIQPQPDEASAPDHRVPPLQSRAIPPMRRASRRKRPDFDYLIAGAGFAGSVLAERLATEAGKRVLLIDRRPHIGGNAYDRYDDAGVLIHQYGPHIFHTNSAEVFAYLSRFTEWRPYQHRVRASVDGQLVPLPINLDTINQLYGTHMSAFEMAEFLTARAEPRAPIRTSEDVVVSKVGRELYEKFFRGYTRKQWGWDPSELDASVTARVPIRANRDDRYFTDRYQAMPLHGYTRLFERMLAHPNIKLLLNCDLREARNLVTYGELIYTGPIDEFFDACFGQLPYRSLRFVFETRDTPVAQPAAVINYPNDYAYTRVTELKYLTGQRHDKTTLVYEYPCADGDPYYPVPRPENTALYRRYKALADATPGVWFVGRLATYQYYNMDQVVAQALTTYKRMAAATQLRSAALSAARWPTARRARSALRR
jgi:UDP-galactopyranose mutase